jgi:tetratricopeptide (TPR) repeat protein
MRAFLPILLLFVFVQVYAQVETPESLYRKAIALKTEHQCSTALPLLQKAAALKPDFADAWYELGWCYNEMQQYAEGLKALQKANELKPGQYLTIYETGFAMAHLNNIDGALTHYNQSLQLNPGFAQAYAAKADLLKDYKNNTAEALTNYLQALKIDTSFQKLNYWIGWCYNDMEDYQRALPYLQKASSFAGQRYLSLSELGFTYYALQQYDQSLAVLLKADAEKPQFEITLYYLGLNYVKLKQKADAVKKYNELVLQGSEYAISLLNEIKNMKCP